MTSDRTDIVSLRDYVERLFVEHHRHHDFDADAVDKALANLNTRMEGINEFRGQLRDQAGTFATRDMHSALVERISHIDSAMSKTEGKMAVLIGLASLMSSFVTAVVTRMLFQ